MNREETIKAIDQATQAHEYQMNKIKALLEGSEIKSPPVVNKRECEFGLWIYDKNNHLKEILGAQFYDNLEDVHGKWHAEYSQIFNIFYRDRKKGFFSKLIGADKIDEMSMDRAKLYYSDLLITTQELFRALLASKRKVSAMADSKFIS